MNTKTCPECEGEGGWSVFFPDGTREYVDCLPCAGEGWVEDEDIDFDGDDDPIDDDDSDDDDD